MGKSEPLDILLTHDAHATGLVIDACRGLSEEDFHRPLGMGVGSLHDTIRHILSAMRGWTDMLSGRAEPRARLEAEGNKTCDELRGLLDAAAAELRAEAERLPMDAVARGSRGGRDFAFTRGGIFTHVTTHGMHHRAQCVHMLKRLGVEPLPEVSVVRWMIEHNPVD